MREEIHRRIQERMVPVSRPPYLDITPIFARDPEAFDAIIDELVAPVRSAPPDCVVGIESMGYLFAVPVARELGVRLIVARKGGKLPQDVYGEDYDVVYSKGQRLEVTASAVDSGDRVLIVDDILAAGGTAKAAVSLVERAGGSVAGIAVFLETTLFPARKELEASGYEVHAAVRWPAEPT